MTESIQLGVLGLIAGGAYALAAIGLVAIYKGSGVLNFSQGAVGMIGTEVYGHWVSDGNNKWLGVAIGILVSAALGAAIHLGITRWLRQASALAKTIATVGVLLVLQGFALLHWGDSQIPLPELFSEGFVTIGKIVIPIAGIWTIGIAILLGLGYWYFFSQTTTGLATEASSINEPATQRFGHRVELLALMNWTLGSAAAGLAGIVIVAQVGLSAGTLTLIVLQAMVAAVVGRFRLIGPAVAAAFVIGAVQSLLLGKVDPGWDEAVPFFIVVIVLLVGGQLVPTRGQITERLPAAPYPRVRPLLIVGGVLIFGLLPLLLTTYWQTVMIYACAYIMVCLSLVLITGYVGQISLAQWALAGFGGFTAGTVAASWGWSMIPATGFAAVCAFALGVVIGYPALRVRGLSLAVLTLAAGGAIHGLYIKQHWGAVNLQAPPPDLFGSHLSQRGFLYVCAALVALAALAVWLLRRSTFGKRLVAIRASERAAQSVGIPVQLSKLLAFGLASSLAAVGGAIYVFQTSNVKAESFDVITGVTLLASVFIIGIGTVSGGIVAGLFVGFGTPLLSELGISTNWFAIISGLGLIITTIQHPDGVALLLWGRRTRGRREEIESEVGGGPELEPPPAGAVAQVREG